MVKECFQSQLGSNDLRKSFEMLKKSRGGGIAYGHIIIRKVIKYMTFAETEGQIKKQQEMYSSPRNLGKKLRAVLLFVWLELFF